MNKSPFYIVGWSEIYVGPTLQPCIQIRCRAGDTAGIVPFNGGNVTCFTRRAVASGLACAVRGIRSKKIQGKSRRPRDEVRLGFLWIFLNVGDDI